MTLSFVVLSDSIDRFLSFVYPIIAFIIYILSYSSDFISFWFILIFLAFHVPLSPTEGICIYIIIIFLSLHFLFNFVFYQSYPDVFLHGMYALFKNFTSTNPTNNVFVFCSIKL